MFEKNTSTKWVIFETAIVMFSEIGYAKVSMRDIGKKVGVSAASIYNHFKSKDEILTSIYDFYEYHMKKILPDINKLLKDAETEEISTLLKMTDPRFEYEIQVLIYRIMVILNMERNTDERCEQLIMRTQRDPIKNTFKLLLNKLIHLGKIEPMDVDTFVLMYYEFVYGSVLCRYRSAPSTVEDWENSLKMIYSLIKPTDKTAKQIYETTDEQANSNIKFKDSFTKTSTFILNA